jgi:hypothetical protein
MVYYTPAAGTTGGGELGIQTSARQGKDRPGMRRQALVTSLRFSESTTG